MLELIVLGQIPGTQLRITIAWFVFALLGVLIWADLKFHASQNTKAALDKTRQRLHQLVNRLQA